MTNQEILEKAIQKAIDGGWDILERTENDGFIVREDAYGNLFVSFSSNPEQDDAVAWSNQEIIFNHDFAKSLWGDFDHFHHTPGLKRWQYHLQQMVIADDPIAYLGANI